MAPLSEELWNEIKSNQKAPLIGSNVPNQGNGFNDEIAWRVNFFSNIRNGFDSESVFDDSFLLRDLSDKVNPTYSIEDEFNENIIVKNCSKDFKETLIRYIRYESSSFHNTFSSLIGDWSKYLAYNGRIVFEIVSWFDNNSKQFYGFQLNRLSPEFYRIRRNRVIFNAPYKREGEKIIFKKVRIPLTKCVIIEFPKEFGGYKGYKNIRKKAQKLGPRFKYDGNPGQSMNDKKKWDKDFHLLTKKWGKASKLNNVSEFYEAIVQLRFAYLSICCTQELIDGLRQVILFLNEKLGEKAELDFTSKFHDKKYFNRINQEWMKGEMSFSELNKYLRFKSEDK